MLVCDNNVCIIIPPKTGSTSLYQALKYKSQLVIGPNHYNDNISKHSVVLPRFVANNDSYTYFLLTRHPYKRLLSLYGAWLRRGHKYTFEEFVKQVVIPSRDIFTSLPIASWYRKFKNKHKNLELIELQLLKCETVLAEYGIEFELQHYNKTEHGTEAEEYNDELLYLAKLWAAEDFELFDYSDEPWW